MLKKDKNGFLQIIKQNGLSPLLFKRYEKDDVDSHPGFIIQLVNSPLFFLARTCSENFRQHDSRFISFSPNFPKSDYSPVDSWADITNAYNEFEYWLQEHVKPYLEEMDIEDLWEQLEGQSLFSPDPLSSRNTDSFTKPEKERIRASLNQFRKFIEEQYEPHASQLEAIEDRLKYLADSLDRLNKVDWQGIAVSTVISISIALNLDTESGKQLFDLFKKAFTTLIEVF